MAQSYNQYESDNSLQESLQHELYDQENVFVAIQFPPDLLKKALKKT